MESTIADARKMKVDELKAALKSAGLSTAGKKSELLERLEALINTSEKPQVQNSSDPCTNIDEKSVLIVDSQTESKVEVEKSSDCVKSNITIEEPTFAESLNEINPSNITEENSKFHSDLIPNNPANGLQIHMSEDATELVDYNDIDEADAATTQNFNQSDKDINQLINESGADKIKTKSLDVSNDKLLAEREMKYRLLALRIRKEKSQSSLVKISPRSAPLNTPTKHVRIDNFQRPFTLKSLQQWLSTTISIPITDSSLWLNNIKTHCYIDFESEDDARKCIEAISGQVYPSTSTTFLAADFTTVSAIEAPTSDEAKIKPGEWKLFKKSDSSDTETVPVNLNDNKPSPRNPGLLNIVKKAAQDSATSVSSSKHTARKIELVSLSKRKAEALQTSNNENSKAENEIVEETNDQPEKKSRPEEQPVTLETLFRKTKVQPNLYWLPVPDKEAEKRLEAKRLEKA